MDIDTQTVVERRKYGAVVASFHLIGKVQTYSFEDLSDTSARMAKPLTGAGSGVGDLVAGLLRAHLNDQAGTNLSLGPHCGDATAAQGQSRHQR
ncbi:MAG: hypothetical protein ACI82I_003380 [Gammaproteobacteria bacterium]|jgi:hypothetical protein